MRQSIIASVALASLASVTLLYTAGPADAKRLNACQIKHSLCSERCIMRNDGAQIGACIQRTCDVQHRGCGPQSLSAMSKGLSRTDPAANPKPPKVGVPGSGVATTPKSTTAGAGARAPLGPVAAKPNGGFRPSGRTF
jgi:hypothetical protein